MPRKARKPEDRTRPKLSVKKGDRVRVITGAWRGAEGTVQTVDREKRRVIIEGVNMVKRHMRKTPRHQQGGIVEKEAPIHVSNVRVIEGD